MATTLGCIDIGISNFLTNSNILIIIINLLFLKYELKLRMLRPGCFIISQLVYFNPDKKLNFNIYVLWIL